MAKITRREFLKLTILAGGAALVLPGISRVARIGPVEGDGGPEVLAGQWTLFKNDLLDISPSSYELDPTFNISSLKESYTYISPVLKADFLFNAVGASWTGQIMEDVHPNLTLRASDDGENWTQWIPMEEIDQFRGLGHNTTDLVIVSGRHIQIQMVVDPSSNEKMMSWDQVHITYINSLQGPTTRDAVGGADKEFRVSSVMAPLNVISRAGWGANESYRFDNEGKMKWPSTYSPAKALYVHHTATGDGGADPAAIVRAVYYYHTITNGWGDIGYNFLIDRYGNIYEGRYGGPNVIGAHTLGHNAGSLGVSIIGNHDNDPVPETALSSLVSLTLAKSVQHGINPEGSFVKDSKTYPNILGHRDALSTSCPGKNLYPFLSTLRQTVSQNRPSYAVAWISSKLAGSSLPQGVTANLTLNIKNSGSQPLSAGGAGRAVIAYTWLLEDGSAYSESGINGSISLPKDVAPYESATIITPIKVPSNLGRYILKLDVYRDGTGFFASQGIPTSEIPLRVASQSSSTQKYNSFIPFMTNKTTIDSEEGGGAAP